MEWWNDLWLNEGFATFMEHFAVKKIFPELFTVSTFDWMTDGESKSPLDFSVSP